jgi:hypothetical protein
MYLSRVFLVVIISFSIKIIKYIRKNFVYLKKFLYYFFNDNKEKLKGK